MCIFRATFVVLLLLGMFSRFSPADESDERLAKELVGVVKDPRLTTRERIEAARMLANLGTRAASVAPDLVAQLKRLRGTEHEQLQEQVIETLGQLGSASRVALPTLAKNVGRSIDLDLAVKRTSQKILAADDSRDLAALIQQLGSGDAGVRLRAVKTLGVLQTEAALAVPNLAQLLNDADGDVRRATVNALRAIQPNAKASKELIAALVMDLKDSNPDIRLLAIRGIGRVGADASVIANLEPLLTDVDKDVRKAAAEAILKLTSP